jgi:hypothetical protein
LVSLGKRREGFLQELEFGGIDHGASRELLRRGAYRNIDAWT